MKREGNFMETASTDRVVDLKSEFQNKFYGIKQRNSRVSLRGVAKTIGVSQSTLSEFLSGKRTLSIDNSEKVIHWLGVESDLADYLLLTATYELTSDEVSKSRIKEKLQKYYFGQIFLDSRRVDDFLLLTEPRLQVLYCKKTTKELSPSFLTRTLVLLRDKVTKEPVESFYELLVDHSNPSVYGGYFLKNSNSYFNAFLVKQFNEGHRGIVHHPANQNVEVQFDSQGFPHVIGTTTFMTNESKKSGVFNFLFSRESMIATGNTFLIERPEEKTPLQVTFESVYAYEH